MDAMPTNSSLLLYQTEDGQTKIEVRLQDETVWLNQTQLCELFDKDKRTISEHIQNIFKEGELMEQAVIRKFRTTALDFAELQALSHNPMHMKIGLPNWMIFYGYLLVIFSLMLGR